MLRASDHTLNSTMLVLALLGGLGSCGERRQTDLKLSPAPQTVAPRARKFEAEVAARNGWASVVKTSAREMKMVKRLEGEKQDGTAHSSRLMCSGSSNVRYLGDTLQRVPGRKTRVRLTDT